MEQTSPLPLAAAGAAEVATAAADEAAAATALAAELAVAVLGLAGDEAAEDPGEEPGPQPVMTAAAAAAPISSRKRPAVTVFMAPMAASGGNVQVIPAAASYNCAVHNTGKPLSARLADNAISRELLNYWCCW
jgi:hypothetical protein